MKIKFPMITKFQILYTRVNKYVQKHSIALSDSVIYNLLNSQNFIDYISDSADNTHTQRQTILVSKYILCSLNYSDSKEESYDVIDRYFQGFHSVSLANVNQYLSAIEVTGSELSVLTAASRLRIDLVIFQYWLTQKMDFDIRISQNIQYCLLQLDIYHIEEMNKKQKNYISKLIESSSLEYTIKEQLYYYLSHSDELNQVCTDSLNSHFLRVMSIERMILLQYLAAYKQPNKPKLYKYAISVGISNSEVEIIENRLESFVLANLKSVISDEDNSNAKFHHRLIKRVSVFFDKNKKRIIQEIIESKELVDLLQKSTTQKLTDEEKAKVKDQLLDILKVIPSFTIFILPFGSLLLPILLKIIPKHLMLPSAFLDESEEKKA